MMRRRAVRLLLFVLLLPLAPGVLAQDVRVWSLLTSPGQLEWLHSEIRAFESATGAHVELEPLSPGELRGRLDAADPEDGSASPVAVIVGLRHTEIGELATSGALVPLEAYATGNYLGDLLPAARTAFETANSIWGLPLWIEGPALIYNRALLPEIPDSYAAFQRELAAISQGGTVGLAFDTSNLYYSYTWLRSFGGYLFGREADGRVRPHEIGISTHGAALGARELQLLRHTYGQLPDATSEEVARLFAGGEVAVIYDGPWAVPRFHNAGIDVGVAPLPERAGNRWVSFMASAGVGVSAGEGDTTAAVNMAKWFATAESQARLARFEYLLPASREAVRRLGDQRLAAFARALEEAEPLPPESAMAGVWAPMSAALSEILAHEAAPAQEILELARLKILD